MGTYGPGEIATLCSWIPPHIAAITAIGPVHLERFKSLDVTLRSKAEIAEKASVVVLNVDDPRLRSLADELSEAGKMVIRCSAVDSSADAAVIATDSGWEAFVSGRSLGPLPDLPFGSNLAVAIGIGVAAGMSMENLQDAFAGASTPDHRQSVVKGAGGAWIVDDTFNSNPAGAASALEKLMSLPAQRRVVVTPGMVELGTQQRSANRDFAQDAAKVVDDFIIVKKTNKRALLAGARNGGATVRVMKTREDAVAWVRSNLGKGDAVLYENDLPDHYA
jgi:UDP-N-acetylmuramoyl-tripeptide--D-alanyl-D-alanine ligase